MAYLAQNVDTEKALEALDFARRQEERIVELEIAEKRAYLNGFNKGIVCAEGIFKCSNYEKDEQALKQMGE